MEGVLYPIAVPTLSSPWWWWSILFLIGAALLLWWIWKGEETVAPEESTKESLQKYFAAWKQEWTALDKKKDSLWIDVFTQQLYVVYASGLDMLMSTAVSAKSLKELAWLEKKAVIEEKEKILFGKLYTPLFSQEWRTTKKDEMIQEVYELIESRWIVLSNDKQS